MTTKKRGYEKPSMRVFDLKQKPSLLAGSGGQGSLRDYTPYNLPEE